MPGERTIRMVFQPPGVPLVTQVLPEGLVHGAYVYADEDGQPAHLYAFRAERSVATVVEAFTRDGRRAVYVRGTPR